MNQSSPKPTRISPIHEQLQPLNGSWQEINDMPVLTTLPNDTAIADRLGLADLSFLTRFGVKGARAAAWLTQQGILLPDRPNSWCSLPGGGIVARLGASEFLLEDSMQSQIAPQLAQACQHPPAQVYPVLRQDAAIALCGTAVPDLLRQTCNLNFRALPGRSPRDSDFPDWRGVIVIPGAQSNRPLYRIWCDGTYSPYVWSTLLTIATELGGGAIGVAPLINLLENPYDS